MEKDFDIEIQDSHDENEAHVQLPMNFLAFGEIEPDDVKVYIKQDVYRALEKYALVDVEHERGTILLGDYCEDLGKVHVIISNYIEARYTDASASTLTFTHETWDYVYKEQGAKYPDKKIVGWQHTHPSYGIFLSNDNSHRPNISPVISGYKQPSKSAQSIEITGFIEKSKPPKIIFLYTLLPLTA